MAPSITASKPFPTIGVLGGGQLGRMMCTAAQDLGIKLIVADPTPNCPAGQFCEQIEGSFNDKDTVQKISEKCDILTVEIEHVNVDAMDNVIEKVKIQPTPSCIRTIQDKYLQKRFLASHNIPVAEYVDVTDEASIAAVGEKFGYPFMLKSRLLAYDGKGNAVVKCKEDIKSALDSLVSKSVYAEKWFPFTKEIAVMVVKSVDGTVASYPVVETIQKDNICHIVLAPAMVSEKVTRVAQQLAKDAIKVFEGTAGVYGVEMFVDENENVVLNEIAPRPHNSGHYTIEACYTSQFENHLRAISGLPLGDCGMKVGASVMINILGQGTSLDETWAPFQTALNFSGANIHWYGKSQVKPGRKMGHITFVGSHLPALIKKISQVGLMEDSTSDSTTTIALKPIVSVVMGSDSDLPKMKACAQILTDFEIPFELTIVSAHRTPHRMVKFAEEAHSRGIKVIVAAAGGAAHLPGMIAAITPLPVIGVPIPLSYLDGVDSLYSICQMPRGVPVATVAIGNSTNAALLAVRMLSIGDSSLVAKMAKYQKDSESTVHAKIDKLDQVGWEAY